MNLHTDSPLNKTMLNLDEILIRIASLLQQISRYRKKEQKKERETDSTKHDGKDQARASRRLLATAHSIPDYLTRLFTVPEGVTMALLLGHYPSIVPGPSFNMNLRRKAAGKIYLFSVSYKF